MDVAAEWSKDIGDLIRRRRLELGLRQNEVADRVGQPRTIVSNWENGTRRPAAHTLELLLAALSLESLKQLTNPPERPTPWAAMWNQLDGYVDPDSHNRVDRFTRQVDTFAALATADLAHSRWQHLLATTGQARAGLERAANQPRGTRTQWTDAGVQLARVVRTTLGLDTAPLPDPSVAGEIFGMRVFVVDLRRGTAGQLGGLTLPVKRLGLATLINAGLSRHERLATLARLLGNALLRPNAGTLVTDRRAPGPPGTRRRNTNYHDAVSAFAAHLVLPQAVIDNYVSLIRTVTAQTATARTTTLHERAISEIVATYTAQPDSVRTRIAPALATSERAAHNEPTPRPGSDTAADPYATMIRHKTHAKRLAPAQLEDFPPGFVDLLVQEVTEGRASVSGIADMMGVDPTAVVQRMTPLGSHLDDVSEQEFSVA